MKTLPLIAVFLFLSCNKPTEPTPTIVGTWDYDAGNVFRTGTIVIEQENPPTGYFYLYNNKWSFGGIYDKTASHVDLRVSGRTVFGASLSSDKKSMSGTYTEPGDYQFPYTCPFKATKR